MLNKYTDVVPEQEPLIVLDSKSAIWMDDNGKDTNHTRNISRRIHFVRNIEGCNFYKTVWCEVGMKLEDIETKNVRED